MCDHIHFKELEGRVDDLEKNQAVHNAASDERFRATDTTIGQLLICFKCVFGAFFILLLILVFAVVYGAIGERGFYSINHAVQELTVQP